MLSQCNVKGKIEKVDHNQILISSSVKSFWKVRKFFIHKIAKVKRMKIQASKGGAKEIV